jgi:hypothetical protein
MQVPPAREQVIPVTMNHAHVCTISGYGNSLS